MNHKIILGIDPGPQKSAYVFVIDEKILKSGYVENSLMLYMIQDKNYNYDICVVEGVRSFGKKVGNETFKTCEQAGIFYQAARSRGKKASIIFRNKTNADGIGCIKTYLTGKTNATTTDVNRVIKNAFPGEWIYQNKHGKLYLKESGKLLDHKLSAAAVVLTYQGSMQYKDFCEGK